MEERQMTSWGRRGPQNLAIRLAIRRFACPFPPSAKCLFMRWIHKRTSRHGFSQASHGKWGVIHPHIPPARRLCPKL